MDPFDWYQRYSGLKDLLSKYMRKTDYVLHAGAGNSRMPEEMIEDGYANHMCIDVSKACVDVMESKHKEKRGIEWRAMDMLALDFPASTFDVVLDKGTLDSVLCGENSTANAAKTLAGVSRVLKPDGTYICVSYGTPEARLTYLENDAYGWNVVVHTVAKPMVSAAAAAAEASDATAVHYVYVCTKGE